MNEDEGTEPKPSRPVPDHLAKIHAHERDPYITFDEGPHIYTVHGEQGYTSVTTWNHSHFEHFNADKIIANILKSPKHRGDPSYKYYGKTAEEIKAMWDTNRDGAATSGTNMHYDIECFYNGWTVTNESTEFAFFRRFHEDTKDELVPYRTEWMIYHEELKISGSVDMVFYRPRDDTYLIYDWKRCREIVKESLYHKVAKTPCIRHLPDTNYWHYALQLNTYKAILEEKYGIRVSELCLVCLHPDNANHSYLRIPVPVLTREIHNLFAFRRTQIGTPPISCTEPLSKAQEEDNDTKHKQEEEEKEEEEEYESTKKRFKPSEEGQGSSSQTVSQHLLRFFS